MCRVSDGFLAGVSREIQLADSIEKSNRPFDAVPVMTVEIQA